jgi:hypothetical protein
MSRYVAIADAGGPCACLVAERSCDLFHAALVTPRPRPVERRAEPSGPRSIRT